MRIKASLEDFINSKYHSERRMYITGPPASRVRPDSRRSALCLAVEGSLKQQINLIWAGKRELINYFRGALGIQFFGSAKDPTIIDFGDFKIFAVSSPVGDGTFRYEDNLFMDANKIWLPRKRELKIKHLPYTYYIEDRYLCEICVFPGNLMYPGTIQDMTLFAQYLRIHRKLPYQISYSSLFSRMKLSIVKKAFMEEWMGEINLLTEEMMDSRLDGLIGYHLSREDRDNDRLNIINIEQKDIDKFVYWSNHRYKVIR